MKKLMIAAAIVCAAVMTHAASAITWGSGALKIDPTTGAATGTGAKGVAALASGTLYNITKAQYDTIMSTIVADSALSTEGMLAVYKAAQAGTYGAVAAGPTATFKGSVALSDGKDIYNEGTTYYALLTYSYTAGEDTYVIANAASYAMGATAGTPGNNGLTIGGATGTIGITQWAKMDNVPEPTSGLLLLLGVAGLALKRRHV